MTRVLVADDEEQVCVATVELLQAAGFEARYVTHATQTAATMRAFRPDVLLQDLRMPGLDIAQWIPALRADRDLEHVRVLIFTASIDTRDELAALDVDGVLEKPFDPERLAAIVSAASRADAPSPRR